MYTSHETPPISVREIISVLKQVTRSVKSIDPSEK